jgi:hypothetical protein
VRDAEPETIGSTPRTKDALLILAVKKLDTLAFVEHRAARRTAWIGWPDAKSTARGTT